MMGWSDRGPTEAPHGTTTTSEVLPTVSRPDGLLRAFVMASGNDREKMPVIVPTGEGLETIGFFSHSDGHGLGPKQNGPGRLDNHS